MKNSPSSAPGIGIRHKASEHVALYRSYVRRSRRPPDLTPIFRSLMEYQELLDRFGGPPLESARVLEIGFGARPYRLIALLHMGVEAIGVDAEVPILDGTLAEYLSALRVNGLERAAKSLLRRTLLDRQERAVFEAEVRRRGPTTSIDRSRFVVADASQLAAEDRSIDLIYSEDVFEHISHESLQTLVPKMARWLSPQGIAIIRPNVFTGITGGHLREWSRGSFVDAPRRRKSEPWEHLREDRFRPDTFLNRLTLADYRELFATGMEILDEQAVLPDLGREFLDPRVVQELADYPDEELFSNQVRFVLRARYDSHRRPSSRKAVSA